VVFREEEERWTHGFDVEGGSTVLQLKRAMLGPGGGTAEDANAFEFRLLGRRVPDFEKIVQEHTFDFVYLGTQVGAQRAREDENNKIEWERLNRQDKEALERRRREEASKNIPGATPPPTAPSSRAAAPAAAPPAAGLQIPSTGPTPAAPAEAKEVAASAPLGPGQHEVHITIDRMLGLTTSVSVGPGATIMDVKVKIAAQDPTSAMKVSDIHLALSTEGTGKAPRRLADGTRLTSAHLRLETTEADAAAEEDAKATAKHEEEDFPKPQPARRPKASQPAPLAPRWEVVGGADKGGILVREGRPTNSTQLADRLATGALVEQIALDGERLKYRKLKGAGPEVGWVSLSVSGKELLKPRKPTPEELLTLDKALELQEELMEGFAKPDFQRALRKILAEHPDKAGVQFMRKRSELYLSVQGVVLPKYGFEGTQAGVVRMMAAFNQPHLGVQEIAWNNNEMQKLIV